MTMIMCRSGIKIHALGMFPFRPEEYEYCCLLMAYFIPQPPFPVRVPDNLKEPCQSFTGSLRLGESSLLLVSCYWASPHPQIFHVWTCPPPGACSHSCQIYLFAALGFLQVQGAGSVSHLPPIYPTMYPRPLFWILVPGSREQHMQAAYIKEICYIHFHKAPKFMVGQ